MGTCLASCASPRPSERAEAPPGDLVGGSLEEPADPPRALDLDPLARRDPYEEANRAFFEFNRGVDWLVFDPLSRAYAWAIPEAGRRGVRRVLENLNSPVVLVNDVLQLRPADAAGTLGRFLVNTTVGVVGIWDPARRMGLEGHHTDFGQTLACAGIPSGPYLVLPLLGPTTARDAVGDAIDVLFRPQTYVLGPGQLLVFGTGEGITVHEQYREVLEELERSAVDYYAALRSAWFLARDAELRERGLLHEAAPDPLLDDAY